MQKIVLLLILGVSAPLAAQDPIPDTTEAWRYFPLEVGNIWEYTNDTAFPEAAYRQETSIERDTVIDNTQYFIADNVWYNSDGTVNGSRRDVLRFDSLAAQVVVLYESEELLFAPYSCSFDAPFPPVGEQLQCGPGPFELVTGIGYDTFVWIGEDALTTAVKRYKKGDWAEIRYAAGVGYIGESGCGGWCYEWSLTYAEISGEVYGEQHVANEHAVPSRPSDISLSVSPNPFSSNAVLSIASASSRNYTVEVFDLLGRRVYSEEHVAGVGETALNLDGTDWPRGLYLVRVTTAIGQTSTTRIARQ